MQFVDDFYQLLCHRFISCTSAVELSPLGWQKKTNSPSFREHGPTVLACTLRSIACVLSEIGRGQTPAGALALISDIPQSLRGPSLCRRSYLVPTTLPLLPSVPWKTSHLFQNENENGNFKVLENEVVWFHRFHLNTSKYKWRAGSFSPREISQLCLLLCFSGTHIFLNSLTLPWSPYIIEIKYRWFFAFVIIHKKDDAFA